MVIPMKFTTKTFKAIFSANTNMWTVKTDEFEVAINNLEFGREGISKKALKCSIQHIEGENVEFEIIDDWLLIQSWTKLKKKRLWDLYNPDMPRNLAKSVTVP